MGSLHISLPAKKENQYMNTDANASTSLFKRELKKPELVWNFKACLAKNTGIGRCEKTTNAGWLCDTNTRLYDLRKDPKQLKPFRNPAVRSVSSNQ